MGNLIGDNAKRLFLVISCLSFVACSQTAPAPSTEYEPSSSPISSKFPECPNLSGTYRLLHGSRESRLFSQYQLPPHEMDMVQLVLNPGTASFTYRLKLDKARFIEQVSKLRSSKPETYVTWRELVTQWQQQKNSQEETSVLEEKISQIGPLPERAGQLAVTQCESFWGVVENGDAITPKVNSDGDDGKSVETETRLSLGKNAALLIRYDKYRTMRFMFGSDMRTGLINSDYAKLDSIQPSEFDWDVTESIAPQPYVQPQLQYLPLEANPSADLPAVLVDVQQYAMSHLPAGAQINEFLLDKASQALSSEQNPVSSAPTHKAALWISMKGETNSNQEISSLMRAMMLHPQLENVELVSVQQTTANKMEFELRLKLKNNNAD